LPRIKKQNGAFPFAAFGLRMWGAVDYPTYRSSPAKMKEVFPPEGEKIFSSPWGEEFQGGRRRLGVKMKIEAIQGEKSGYEVGAMKRNRGFQMPLPPPSSLCCFPLVICIESFRPCGIRKPGGWTFSLKKGMGQFRIRKRRER